MVRSQLLPIYTSMFVWHVGQSLIGPFTSIWLRQVLGESSFLRLGLVLSFPMVISLTGILGLSQLTDRFAHYREIILLINLVGMFQYLLLTQITHAFQYLIIVGFGSLIAPAYYMITLALATNVCNPAEKGRTTNYLLLYASAGYFLGSIVAGHGYKELGMVTLLFFAAILVGISGFIILASPESPHLDKLKQTAHITPNHAGIPKVYPEASKNPSPVLDQSSFFKILKRPQFLLILLSIAILDFSLGSFFVFGNIFLNERTNIPYEYLGYSFGILTLLATLILWRLGGIIDQTGRKPVYVFGLSIYPLMFAGLSLFHQPEIAFLLSLIPGYAFLRPTVNTMISDLTLDHERSRGLSLYMSTSSFAMFVGALYGGWVADNYSIAMDFWTIFPAILTWLAVFLGLIWVKETLNVPVREN